MGMWQRARSASFLAVILVVALAIPVAASDEAVDLDAVYRIKSEGFNHSQVMNILRELTDVHGPRLTNSPQFFAAADYAVELLNEWGIENARTEAWGDFGLGWSNQRFYAHVTEPVQFPLIGYPKAWTPGTEGRIEAEAVMVTVKDEDDLDELKGKLAGKFVLAQTPPETEPRWEAQARRYTDEELAELAAAPQPGGRRGNFDFAAFRAARAFRTKVNNFLRDEGVAAVLEPSGRAESGTAGTLFVSSGGPRDPEEPQAPPQVVLTSDHYGRLWRLLEKGESVRLEVEIASQFHDDDLQGYNVFAEFPGTDLADEVVMLGAHFDSWHAGTGATDNAAGSAAMLEAIRILKQSGLQPRRTIRIALWSGEEQGLLGSRGWVASNLADPADMDTYPEHGKVSAYYNLDNGTGAIRGVYMQGNEGVEPIFAAWMKPLSNLGMTTLTIRNTGGTDHLAFDAVGVPGFQFIQDPMEYRTRSHHSNFDTYERLVPADMMKNAVIIATFAYHTAMRDELLPRKPLPEASAGRGPFGF